MHPNPYQDERLKLHEAIGVTALVTFVAASMVVVVATLSLRCVVIDAYEHFNKKGK